MDTNKPTNIIKLPSNTFGAMSLESALTISLLLVKSHKRGAHKNGNVAECALCKTRRG